LERIYHKNIKNIQIKEKNLWNEYYKKHPEKYVDLYVGILKINNHDKN
jgi:hypothetical protein